MHKMRHALLWWTGDDFPYNFVSRLAADYRIPDALHRYSFEELVTMGSLRGCACDAHALVYKHAHARRSVAM